jgi:hypothetical protein
MPNCIEGFRILPSLTVRAEWVQVFSGDEVYVEECTSEPRIERCREGWRYNVIVADSVGGIAIHRGPSYTAEKTGIVLYGGQIVIINERVFPADDNVVWLRLKETNGWIPDRAEDGTEVIVPHSLLRHRSRHTQHQTVTNDAISTVDNQVTSRPQKPPPPPPTEKEAIAYNTIIARLFHSDGTTASGYRPRNDLKLLR